MGGEAVGPEGTGRRLAPLVGGRCQLVEEGSASWIECRQDLLGGLGDGYERTSGGLRERPEELNDEPFRRAGTSQRNGASSTRATASSGTSMVMPSSGAAGSNV